MWIDGILTTFIWKFIFQHSKKEILTDCFHQQTLMASQLYWEPTAVDCSINIIKSRSVSVSMLFPEKLVNIGGDR